MSTPIYQAARCRYEIDSCLPQLSAIREGKVGFGAISNGHYPGRRIPPKLLPGVSSMGFFDVPGGQDWGIGTHRNEGIELCYQETGTWRLTVDERTHDLEPGTVSITRPWQAHRLGDPHLGPGRLHWIILDVGVRRPNQPWRWPNWCVLAAEDLRELTNALRGNEHPVWPAGREIAAVFQSLAGWVADRDPVRHGSRMRVALNQLFIGLLEMFRHQSLVPDPELRSRRRTVELFLRDLARDARLQRIRWSLPLMAEQCGMGRTTFSLHCREMTNRSPIAYLNHCRLDRAERILRESPEVPVAEVAAECGFASSQYFSRQFLSRRGVPPGLWRRKP